MAAHFIEIDDLLAQRTVAAAVDLSSRRRVSTDLQGTHLSAFRGRGMEFEEHRVYQPGDEVRTIDWRVTARTGETHVRLYREERERPVLIAVDYRAAMWFGTRRCFKAVLAARVAAALAWAAVGNGDRVGGFSFGRGHAESRPAGGRRGVSNFLHQLCQQNGEPQDEGLSPALRRLLRIARPGAVVCVISDFRGLDSSAEDQLRQLARHCELILVRISDPLERAAPPPGRYPVRAQQQAELRVLDTRQTALRQHWSEEFSHRTDQIQKLAATCRGHCLELGTEQDLSSALAEAFGLRRRRVRA